MQIATNCITEIPQDIKLELNNGTLTLKAGSKVYVPNGVGVFDAVSINSDMVVQVSTGATGSFMVFYSVSTAGAVGVYVSPISSCGSGSAQASGTVIYYNTTDNTLAYYENSTKMDNRSFPLAIITVASGVVTSIDQTFNGFGYIGNSLFALPGVKGLIPNGRNADGSLKNTEFETNGVKTSDASDWIALNRNFNGYLVITGTTFQFQPSYRFTTNKVSISPNEICFSYSEDENRWYVLQTANSNWEPMTIKIYAKVSLNGTGITFFNPKLPFQAVDRSNGEWAAHNASPSKKYIDLTLGASGTSYTAPAGGWFVHRGLSRNTNLINHTSGLSLELQPASNAYTTIFVPCKKGDSIGLIYAGGSTIYFKFVYAEGSK